ncbi:MAG: DNA-3-methyladenine glycosylase 2 family protein [Roseibium sp.]|uniref:DNA-3-methyladenine glycosylase family protein n=1 Tax=Roseibium sp. TaxID=1936156 RepID=UPI003D9C2719
MTPIETDADVQRGLTALLGANPDLAAIASATGALPLRRRAADFAGLTQIVTAQQVSVASAAAIFERVRALISPLTPETLANFSDADLAAAGLSRPKIKTIRAVAAACEGGLDLERLAEVPASEAHATLCEIKGIGRWSADIFLLFCAGHPDVFPSGDLALQIAVQDALGLETRPAVRDLDEIALKWAPHRAVAARLFWSWYRVMKNGRETLPV